MPSLDAPVPKQRRSRRTRDKILTATERLLRERTFEEISVQRIARAAGVSIGSVYNLYGSKEAVLPDLYRRHCDDMGAMLAELLRPSAWEGRSLAAVVRFLVQTLVDLHVAQRGLLRALVLRGHCRTPGVVGDRTPEMDEVIPRVARLLHDHPEVRGSGVGHPNPRRGARVGLVMVLAMVREALLYPQTTAHVLKLSDKALVEEMTRALLGYLRQGEAA